MADSNHGEDGGGMRGYEEPPDWDWEELLDNVGADQLIINLAAEFKDEGGD
jgi:hypothetical protein